MRRIQRLQEAGVNKKRWELYYWKIVKLVILYLQNFFCLKNKKLFLVFRSLQKLFFCSSDALIILQKNPPSRPVCEVLIRLLNYSCIGNGDLLLPSLVEANKRRYNPTRPNKPSRHIL